MREKIECTHVFLDAGMTLIEPEPHFVEGIRRVLEENGVDTSGEDVAAHAADAIAFINAEIDSGRRYAVSDEADEEFWGDVYERLVRRFGLDGDSRGIGMKIYRLYQTPYSFELFPDARPALEALSSAGFRLGIISNFATVLYSIFDRIGIRDMFDPFIVSATEGCMKPDIDIFEIALERTGAAPGRCVMVGDNPVDDVRGASSAGIVPILLDRHSRHGGADGIIIKSLSELPEILKLAQ